MFRPSLLPRKLPFIGYKFFSTLPRVATLNTFAGLKSNFSSTSPLCREISSSLLNTKPEFISTILPATLNISTNLQQIEFQEEEKDKDTIYMDSVLRKRRLKMKKHKLRKRRRAQRSLKKRLGKL